MADLKALRHREGLTQRQVAARLGVTTMAISYIERGVRTPGYDLALALADLYGVPVTEVRQRKSAQGA